MLYLGADHRGYGLKEKIKEYLTEGGYEFKDLGAYQFNPRDDYPDFASAVARKISKNPQVNQGLLLCGSGVGVDVVANKFKNVRSALVFNPRQARASRRDDDSNILSLAADFLDESEVSKIIKVWLETEFSRAERHERRLDKVRAIELENKISRG